jgi:hypothetical protein
VSSPTPEAAASSAVYSIDWYSINGGGTVNATSPSYQLGASIGQSVAGAATSANYQMGIGFWYGAGGAGGCACDCHGDPGGPCDTNTDIVDVTQTVNAAFRNAAPMIDPNPNCPYQIPDVNCSGDPDVVDVVKMVAVAFRNGNPAVEFCNPCPLRMGVTSTVPRRAALTAALLVSARNQLNFMRLGFLIRIKESPQGIRLHNIANSPCNNKIRLIPLDSAEKPSIIAFPLSFFGLQ